MEIGVSNCIFGRRNPIEDDFLILKENNINQVEINLKSGWFDINDRNLTAKVIGWIEKHGMIVNSVHGPSGFPGISPVYNYSGFRDWIANPNPEERLKAIDIRKKCIDIAALMNARYFIIEYECYHKWPFWPHNHSFGIDYPESAKLWRQSVDELVCYCASKGVKAAIENIDGFSCEEIAEYVRGLPSGTAGICFDTSHATYGNFMENFNCLKQYIITTHVSDNDGLEGEQWLDRHWMPFRGGINWDEFIGKLAGSGYDGCIMLEINFTDIDIHNDLKEPLLKLRNIIRRYRY